jgi:methyl-accepting chemotaxis protein
MRDAAHKLEDLFAAEGDEALLNKLLSMRRNEKDFMLRKDLVYFEKFSKNYQSGRESILSARHLSDETRDQSLTYLDAYKDFFLEMVEKMRSEGLSYQEGNVRKMTVLSVRCEEIIDRISSMLTTALQREETRIKVVRGILTVFSAMSIISLLCVLFMRKNDSTSKSGSLSTVTSSLPEDSNGTPG